MAIMDIIKKRRKGGPAAVSAEDVATHQQAGATGKVGRSTGGPQMSNVGSQLAAQQGQAQLGAIQTQGMAQTQALGAAEKSQDAQFDLAGRQQAQKFGAQKAGLATQNQISNTQRAAQEEMSVKQLTQQESLQGRQMSEAYAEAVHTLASNKEITEQQIYSELSRSKDSLNQDKFVSRLDQATHMLAMSDQKYADEIRRIGSVNNLQDNLIFKKESQRIAFGQDFQILANQFNMQALANADAREFQQMMATMDLDTAISLAAQASKEQAYKSVLTGMTSGATAYSKYGGSADTTTEDTRNYTTTGEASGTSGQLGSGGTRREVNI